MAAIDPKFDALFCRGMKVNADGAGQAVTVTAADSGVMFVNKEDAGTVTYTLPTAAACKGKHFIFYNAQTTQNIAVTGGTDDVLVSSDDANYDKITDDGNYGNWCIIIGDGSSFYALIGAGTWTGSG